MTSAVNPMWISVNATAPVNTSAAARSGGGPAQLVARDEAERHRERCEDSDDRPLKSPAATVGIDTEQHFDPFSGEDSDDSEEPSH